MGILVNTSQREHSLPQSSLIICSRNRPRLLLDLVNSVLCGNEWPTEIVIIDDSDEENQALASLVPAQPVALRYVWNHSRGLSQANNTGAALARHELLVFTQDDVLVAPDWFGKIVRAQVRAGRDAIITGRTLPGEAEVEDGFAPSTIADDVPRTYAGRIGEDVLYMQNASFYKSVGEAVNWFDPDIGPGTPFPTAEDNEFAYRLLEAGYRIIYEPAAVTRHRAWRGKEDERETNWNYGRGQGAFIAKHAGLSNPHMLWRLIRESGYISMRGCVRLLYTPRRAVNDFVYLYGYLSAVVAWRKSRVSRSERESL